ncbi:S-layer homology domain-containing protein [Paenibacillus sp. SAF-054]|uniref:S-layer homology domain-containing protein n=1 Tax=unclassified Paenibacillus TaxID=185978 RepID=UPI003F7F5E87
MKSLRKAALAAALLLGAQQAFPLLAMAEISVEPIQGNPYSFIVTDAAYTDDNYLLQVESMNESGDRMYVNHSPNPPSEPYVINIDPATWVPGFDLDDPRPVTFRVTTIKKEHAEIMDNVDYHWSMVSTVKGSIPVNSDLASRISLTLTPDAGAETTLRDGEQGMSYDSTDQSLHFEMNTTGSGPYMISAEWDGQPFGSLKVKPDSSNRAARETRVVDENGGHQVHTYFDVDAGTLIPYTFDDQVSPEALDVSDEMPAELTQTPSGDREMAKLDLPFGFNFYGDVYNRITISPMGALYFGDQDYDTLYMNEYPDNDSPPALHPYLGNMEIKPEDPSSGIYTKTVGEAGDRKFIVQWNHMYYLGTDAPVTFQAILDEKSGSIRFQYPQIDMDGAGGGQYDNGQSATIGIQAQGGNASNYLLYSQNMASLSSGQAICFGTPGQCGTAEPVQQYGVTYDSNGSLGRVPADPEVYEEGARVTVLGNPGEMSFEGHSFGGWNTQADGKGTNYNEGDTFIMGNGNVTLYANWIPDGAQSDGALISLQLSTGTLTPAFRSNTTKYAVSVANGVSSVTVTPAPADSGATLTVNGEVLTAGEGRAIALREGNNTITVVVTSHDGLTTQTYTISVNRASASTGNPDHGGSDGNSGGGGSTGGSNGIGGGASASGASASGSGSAAAPVPLKVGGSTYNQVVTASTRTDNGQTIVTASLDSAAVQSLLLSAGEHPTLTIPLSRNADRVSLEFQGDALQALKEKNAVLELETSDGAFKVPAGAIQLDELAAGLGTENLQWPHLKIRLEVSKGDATMADAMEAATKAQGMTLIAAPVQFTVMAAYQGKAIQLGSFASYVQQVLRIPEGVDASRITTAVMMQEGGALHPVPFQMTDLNGKKAVVLTSLSGGRAALTSYPASFGDVKGSWAQDVVSDMASRWIMQGAGESHFDPAKPISRGEFASALVRALGIAANGKSGSFTDLNDSPYAGAITQANNFGLISGYGDGTFHPESSITREEAMVIVYRAMKLAGLNINVEDASRTLESFADQGSIAAWAKDAAAAAVQNKLMQGSDGRLHPAGAITKAETAALLQRLLRQSGFIQ